MIVTNLLRPLWVSSEGDEGDEVSEAEEREPDRAALLPDAGWHRWVEHKSSC